MSARRSACSNSTKTRSPAAISSRSQPPGSGIRVMRRCAGPRSSRRWRAVSASSPIGANAAGPRSVIRRARRISSASEVCARASNLTPIPDLHHSGAPPRSEGEPGIRYYATLGVLDSRCAAARRPGMTNSARPALPADGAPFAAALGARLIGDPGVVAAIGQALDRLAAAEEELARTRIADRPAALAVVEFEKRTALAQRNDVLDQRRLDFEFRFVRLLRGG